MLPILIKDIVEQQKCLYSYNSTDLFEHKHFFEHNSKETLPYTLAALSSLVLSECPSSEGGIVAGCEPKTSFGIHQWKHEDWMLTI